MPAYSSYYLNGPSLASSTAVFDNSTLTVKAADGWYSDGEIVREQSSGLLLPQQNCGGDFIPIHISLMGATYQDACELLLTQYCYNDPVGGSLGIIGIGDTVYKDFCSNELLEDGYYNAVGSLVGTDTSWFRCISGIVTQIGFCDDCYQYTIFTNTSGGATYIDCSGNPASVQIGGTSGYDEATFCAEYGTVVLNGDASIINVTDCIL